MVLVTGSGRPITVGALLAAGGQGEVFTVSSPPGQVFKRYLASALAADPALDRRLRAMVRHPPPDWRESGSGHMTVAWPSQIVLNDGRFAGFLMPAADITDTVSLHRVTNPSDRRTSISATSWLQEFTWRYLVRTGANLAHATRLLHDAGTVIGDFNESNVRVSREARVTLLDCDSMQITNPATGERFFCPVGRPEFTPPELINANWTKTVRHPSSDLFALAVHLYQLLLEGEHPFRGIWRAWGEKPSVPELARQGIWAHRNGGPLSPRPRAISASLLLPEPITAMFRAAFEDGAVNPGARPTAERWQQALTGLDARLRQCRADTAHIYSTSLPACPWCRHAATARQPMPPAAGRPAACPSRPPPPAATPFSPTAQPAQPSRSRHRPRRPALTAGVLSIAAVTAVVAAFILRGTPTSPFRHHIRGLARTLTDAGHATSNPQGVAFSPNGKAIATADGDGHTYLWNVASGHKIATFAVPRSGPGGVRAVAFSPDGKTLAAAGGGRTYLWNVASRRRIATLTDPHARAFAVLALAFQPGGRTLATADGDGRTYLWDVASEHKIATLTDPHGGAAGVRAVAFTPDGKTLATGDSNGHAYLWNVARQRRTATLTNKVRNDPVLGVAFSPRGKTLAVGDLDGSTYLWNVARQQNIATLADRGAGSTDVTGVAFSPNGKTLATGDLDGSTYLWNVARQRDIAEFTNPGAAFSSGGIIAVAFSPDGKILAAASEYGSTCLWNIRGK